MTVFADSKAALSDIFNSLTTNPPPPPPPRMGMLQPGDVLLAINEQSLDNATLRDAANLLKDAGDVVTLKVSKDNANIGE